MAYSNFPSIKCQYSLQISYMFDTVVVNFGSKVSQRIAQEEDPTCKYKMKFIGKKVADMDTILNFFIARKGSFEPFYINDEKGVAHLVCFEKDNLDLEYFMYQLYNLNEVTFVETAP